MTEKAQIIVPSVVKRLVLIPLCLNVPSSAFSNFYFSIGASAVGGCQDAVLIHLATVGFNEIITWHLVGRMTARSPLVRCNVVLKYGDDSLSSPVHRTVVVPFRSDLTTPPFRPLLVARRLAFAIELYYREESPSHMSSAQDMSGLNHTAKTYSYF